jgi:hypothetical protein
LVSALQKYMQEREAGKKRTQELRSMSASETIKYLVKSEPERNRTAQQQGYRALNLAEFLQQKGVSSDPSVELVVKNKPIDVDKVESWQQLRDSQKRTELRKTLADFETIPNQIPRGTPKTEEPAARRMGFGQGGGVANLGLQTITTEQPQNYTDFVLGRINTPIEKPKTITEEPEIITEKKEIPFEYTKLALIGGGIVALIAIIMIVRAKK